MADITALPSDSADDRRPERDDRPDLSIVIVAYECLPLLRDCLATLADGADGLRLEVIVVDNCSSDGTR